MEKNSPSYQIDLDTIENTGRMVYGNYTTHIQERGQVRMPNYTAIRAVTLLSFTYKVLSLILYNNLAEYEEEILEECRFGFRGNRSTIDRIFAVRQSQEKAYEYNIHLRNLLIEFKQAFDSVDRGRMLNDLMIVGTPKKLVQLISVTMAGSKATVRVDNQYASTIIITNGLRQGDALSSILFDLVLSNISEDEHHWLYGNKKYTNFCIC